MKKQQIYILRTTDQDINGHFDVGEIQGAYKKEKDAWKVAHDIAEEKGYLEDIEVDEVQDILENEFEVINLELE